ncbi:MAG TPA: flagellar filament outer layer protein FlaA [Rectinemataceae bacterium]|nr:flagellar filament outer layer protein FlaA [Rectinemataceae bacterium]
MRRQFFVIALALLFVGGVALSADEAVLMDFNLLKADIIPDPANQGVMTQNRATMMDFSSTAGASFTDEQKKQMRTSLAIGNWDVLLASSSQNILNNELSYTKEAAVSASAKQYAGQTVFGVRIHFPTAPFNSWARINPPFEIPAFEPKATIDDQGVITPVGATAASGTAATGTTAAAAPATDPINANLSRFEGSYDTTSKVITAYGIVKNVGTLKSVAVTVRGLQFPHGLYAVLTDQNNDEHMVFMGYLNFDGWKELRWDNPQYVSQVRNRELRIDPLYPASVPFVKLAGFVITRDANAVGGDFVAYFKDVKILYDRAVLDPVRDINDEAVWGIISDREKERKILESRSFGNVQVERYLEKQKQDTNADFSASTPTK